MPTPKAAPMYASRRREGTVARRQTARASSAAARRQQPSAVTTAQVKAVVLANKEDKYMNPTEDVVGGPLAPTTGAKAVSVLAFATTATLQTGQVNPVTYCGRPIANLNMLRPFNSTNANAYHGNIIDGNEVKPTYSATMFSLERMAINLVLNSTDQTIDAQAFRTCPIRCRIVRVTPKLQAGVSTSIDPTNDLFLNQFGAAYGANNVAYSALDAEHAVVNTRVYTVLGDEKVTLAAAPAVQANYVVQTGGGGVWAADISRPPGALMTRRFYKHQLAAKKGGNVRFLLPNDATTVNADSGHRREYIFFHFWYINVDGLTVIDPPGGSAGPDGETPQVFQDIKVHCRTVSKFKDI